MKIHDRIDLSSLETSWFNVRLSSPLTTEEIKLLNELGGELYYDNGTFALIQVKPVRLEEFAKIESVISIG